MDIREAMARRYCIIRNENPDELYKGMPLWKDALIDIESVLMMLDSFGFNDPFENIFSSGALDNQLSMDFVLPEEKVIRLFS